MTYRKTKPLPGQSTVFWTLHSIKCLTMAGKHLKKRRHQCFSMARYMTNQRQISMGNPHFYPCCVCPSRLSGELWKSPLSPSKMELERFARFHENKGMPQDRFLLLLLLLNVEMIFSGITVCVCLMLNRMSVYTCCFICWTLPKASPVLAQVSLLPCEARQF